LKTELRLDCEKERLDLLKKRARADLLAQTGAHHSRFCFARFSRIPGRAGLDDGGRSCDVLPSRPARPILPRPTVGQRRRAVREQPISLERPRIPGSQTQSHRSAKSKEAGSNQRGRRSGLSQCEIPIPELRQIDRWVLNGINLRIRPGEHVALVGENGSGKSTLVKLLARLYDPTDGFITMDGVDLRELSFGDLRRKIERSASSSKTTRSTTFQRRRTSGSATSKFHRTNSAS
jgi:ABC-type multidrug transport system fused ATPase/permease subunit